MVTTRSKSLKVGSEVLADNSLQLTNKSVTSRTKKSRNVRSGDTYSQLIIFISLLLDLLAFTIILPIFPRLLLYYQKYDSTQGLYSYLDKRVNQFSDYISVPREFNIVLFGGCLGSLFSFLQFLASPIVGAFSDVYGRKIVILLCMVGLAASYFLWSISTSFVIFVVARIIAGISKGNLSLSMAAMTDVSSTEERGSGMALIGAAFSIGFVVGPLIGVFCIGNAELGKGDMVFFKPALLAFGLMVVDILFVLFCFKETLPKEKRMKSIASSLRQAFAYINVSDLFQFSPLKSIPQKDLKQLRTLGLVYFLYLFFYSGLEFTMTFLMYNKFKFTSIKVGCVFCVMGLVMAILQGGGVRRIPSESTHKFAALGLLLTIPSFLCVGVAQNQNVLFLGVFIYAVSTSLVVPLMTTLVSKYGTSSQKGTALGIFRSLGALARALGPIVASAAYWSIGPLKTYCAGGILLLIPWYLMKNAIKTKL